MAENEFRYLIRFDSVAERTGARNTVEDVRSVDTAVKRVSDSTRTWALNSSDAASFLDRTGDKARVAEFAFYDLDATIQKTSKTVDAVASGSSAKVPKMGAAFQQASFQVQDFATQVAGGTSALVSIGQQAPQFLGIFGPAGAIAGAVVSVGALIGNVLLKTTRQAEEAKESLIDLEELGRNVGENLVDDLDQKAAELKRQRDLDKALSAPDTAGEEARANAARTQQESTQALLQATELLNQLMGRQVAAVEAIAAAEARREQDRQRATQDAIAAEEKKAEAAGKAVDQAVRDRDLQQEAVVDTQFALEQQREKLELLRQQKAELEEMAKETEVVINFAGGPTQRIPTKAAEEAQFQLQENGAIAIKIAEAEGAVAAMEERAGNLADSVFGLTDSIAVAKQKFDQQVAASAIEIENIIRSSGNERIIDAGRTAVETQKEIVSQAKGLLTEVQTYGGQLDAYQKQSKAALSKAIEDGVLTAQELGQMGANIQGILGNYKGPMDRIINLIDNLNAVIAAQQNRISKLEADSAAMRTIATTPQSFR